ncbi:MAG: outer membrane protein assembly factor BamD [Alphaproteobacteria bacterium]
MPTPPTPPTHTPKITQRILLTALLLALCIPLAACNRANDEVPYADRAAEDLFDEGEQLMAEEAYTEAAELFNEVERQHPHSDLAPRALLLSGYALYSNQNYAEALATFQRFIDLHPGNVQIDYAYYLRSICYYEQISDIERDQEMTRLAVDALEELMQRYPESQYARDAQLKLDLAYDLMAGKHVSIGRYYQHIGDWLAAINRFNRVIEEYETTTHIEEALHRLVESYLALGLEGEARRTAAVLGHNYPNSEWYSLSYALVNGEEVPDDSPLLERSFRGLF